MKVYLAAQYARRDELKVHADALQKIGIEVTARWVQETLTPTTGTVTGASSDDPAHITEMAERDIEDIDRADLLLLFTNGPDTKIVRGAHHFESGYAYGCGTSVWTVGPKDNVFHYLPCVKNYPTWAEAFDELKRFRHFEETELGY